MIIFLSVFIRVLCILRRHLLILRAGARLILSAHYLRGETWAEGSSVDFRDFQTPNLGVTSPATVAGC
jgi:hypothetical protein